MSTAGVCAGLPREARPLARMPPPFGRCARLPAGNLLTVSGMGAERAAAAAMRLLGEGAEGLISWGTAGALDPALVPGTLLLPERVTTADGPAFETDARWRAVVLRRLDPGLPVRTGLLVQTPEIANTPEQKRELHLSTGAVAVDMESAALAAAAREAGVPFLVVRAVTDTARVALPASITGAVDASGRVRALRLLGGLIAHPADVLALPRLGSGFRAALKALTRAAESINLPSLDSTERRAHAGPTVLGISNGD